MTRFVTNWIVIVIAVFIAVALLPGHISYRSTTDILIFALVLGLLDAFVAPVLRIISLPLTIITFGLFSLVLNAILFWLATVLEGNISVDGFLYIFIAALIVSAVNLVVGRLL